MSDGEDLVNLMAELAKELNAAFNDVVAHGFGYIRLSENGIEHIPIDKCIEEANKDHE